MMKELIMTVNFLFTEGMEELLLVKKNRGPYPNHFNGVGGKFDRKLDVLKGDGKYLNMKRSANREIREEAKINIPVERLHWLVTEIFPEGKTAPWGIDGRVELWVFYAIVDKAQVQQMEDEKLSWFKVERLKEIENQLAGDGNVPYFIDLAFKHYKNN